MIGKKQQKSRATLPWAAFTCEARVYATQVRLLRAVHPIKKRRAS